MLEPNPDIIPNGEAVKFRAKKARKSKWYDKSFGLQNHISSPSLSISQMRTLEFNELTVRRYDAMDNTYLLNPYDLWVSARFIKRVK